MNLEKFIRVLPLLILGSFFFSYVVKYDTDYRAFLAVLGASMILLAGIAVGIWIGTHPEDPSDKAGNGGGPSLLDVEVVTERVSK